MGPLFIGCQWQRLTQQRGEVGSLAKRLNCYHPSSLSPHSLKYTNPNINTNTSMWIRVFDNIGLNINYEAFCLSLCLFVFHFKSVPLFWTRHFHIYFVFLSCLVLSISCLFLPVPAASYKSISSDTAPAPVDKGKVLRKKNHRKQCISGDYKARFKELVRIWELSGKLFTLPTVEGRDLLAHLGQPFPKQNFPINVWP